MLQPLCPKMATGRSFSSRSISSPSAVRLGIRDGALIARSHPVISDLPFPGTAWFEALGSVGNALRSGPHS